MTFAGSNITGEVAEQLERCWLAFELVEEYLEASKFRFPGLYQQQALFGPHIETTETETFNEEAESQIIAQLALLESKPHYKSSQESAFGAAFAVV